MIWNFTNLFIQNVNLIDLYKILNRINDAVKICQNYLEIVPDNEEFKNILENLNELL